MEARRTIQSRTTAVVAGASVLALLGGVGGAVAHGMISSGDIANQSIRSVDIKKGGVGKSELREDSVDWFGELNAHTRQKIRSLAGEDGAVGAQGPAGPAGPQGEQGAPGMTGFEAVESVEQATQATPDPWYRAIHESDCPPGKSPISGGHSAFYNSVGDSTGTVPHNVLASGLSGDRRGWRVTMTADRPFHLRVTVYCAVLTP